MVTEPQFTEDWFTTLIPRWTELLAPLHQLDSPRILEIGAFEGRSTRWLLETFPRAVVTTIDPFDAILGQDDSEAIYQRFGRNVNPFGPRCFLIRQQSCVTLPSFIGAFESASFDFIYVDGSHEASDVIMDAVLGYRLLAPNGLMCFDDFYWDDPRVPADRRPQVAIMAFLQTHKGLVEMLCPAHRQVWVRKVER